ncbi:GGDEF domain-containing protein [Thiomicrorhabdus hydrogeniphila]
MSLIKKYFTRPKTSVSLIEYRQRMMLTVILPLGYITMTFFGLYNSLVLLHPYTSAISITSAGMLLAIHIYFKKSREITTPIFFALIAFALFLLTFNYINQNHSFGLVWTVVFPIVAIISLGRIWGSVLSLVIFIILFAEMYIGLGSWQNGQWNSTGLLRISLAYFAIGYIVFMIDYTFEQTCSQNKTATLEPDDLTERFPITKDPLTNLYNRCYLSLITPLLSVQIKQQQSSRFIFALIKIDRFTHYNQTYGHQQGDKAILKVSSALQKQVDEFNGTLYRLSGNEFAISSLSKQTKPILQNLKKLNQIIEELEIENIDSELNKLTITMSVLVTENYAFFDFDEQFNQANSILKNALQQGINQTIITVK